MDPNVLTRSFLNPFFGGKFNSIRAARPPMSRQQRPKGDDRSSAPNPRKEPSEPDTPERAGTVGCAYVRLTPTYHKSCAKVDPGVQASAKQGDTIFRSRADYSAKKRILRKVENQLRNYTVSQAEGKRRVPAFTN
jgi:hypothetical protein